MSSIIFFNTILFISGFVAGQLCTNIQPNITILPLQKINESQTVEEPPPFNEEGEFNETGEKYISI